MNFFHQLTTLKQFLAAKPGCGIYLPFAFALIFFFIFTACQDKIPLDGTGNRPPVVSGVVVSRIVPSPVDDYYVTSGTVRAKETSMISSRIMGTVVSVRIKEGDHVKTGQLLLTLDDRDAMQKMLAAEQGLEAARQNSVLAGITYQRNKILYDEKALSGQEIDQIETQKKIAETEFQRMKASLEEARIFHGFTRIVSPVTGRITEKKIEVGSMAIPGAPLLIVENDSGFNIETYIDESLSGKLKTGIHVDVNIDAIGLTVKGRIIEIVPAIDQISRTFRIKIAVEAPQLKSGLYARVMLPLGKKEILLVPHKSLKEKGQLTGVYTVNTSGVIAYTLVRTGKLFGDNVEVLSGINAGESVITGGMDKALDGGIVSIGKTP